MSRLHPLRYILVSISVLCPTVLRAQTSPTPTFTTINLNNTVLQSPVKRLGMNLGAANYYDSGQMLKNLIVSNPGFEGQIAQTMVLCSSGTAASCTDSISYAGWPADYWDGATYTVVYGNATGRTGTISTSTSGNGQAAVFNLSDSGTPLKNGDYMVMKKPMPGGATEGWTYTLGSNGAVSTNTTDLPPGTQGTQSVVLTAPAPGDSATLTYYFDSTSYHTFLQLNGTYTLSFKAKTTIPGGSTMYVSLQRLSGLGPYVYDTAVPLTNQWQTFNYSFTASEDGTVIAPVRLIFATAIAGQTKAANQVYLDDTSLVQQNTDPTNKTVFRDPVVNTLKQLNPGVIRFWFNQLGETLDNLLAPPLGRQRSQYQYVDINYITYGLGEFLQLCQTVGSGSNASSSPPEPWIVLPMTLSNAEASNLIDYLAGDSSTVYGAKRIAAGQIAPWTTVFPKIHLELGNEAWNNLFYGGNMTVEQAYGTHAQAIFSIMRNNPNYKASAFDLMINGTAYSPFGISNIQFYCNNNDSFAAQPYLILNANDPNASGLTGAAAIENLFGSTLAEPEAFVTPSGTAEGITNGLVLQDLGAAQSSGRPVQFAVTETNISPYGGSITQAELNSYVTSMGGGLAVVDSMLQNMRVGVLNQNLFQLSGYVFNRGDYKTLYLFGSVVDMGVTNLKRPQFLAEQLANSAIGANTNMLQTVHTGRDPTWNQAQVNSVQLNNAHYLQSFGFSSGDNYSLIIINTNRSASEQVNFSGANIPGGTVQMTQLTSANITDTNETASLVAPVSSTLLNFNAATGMTLPPYSMTVLTWTAPAISNVTVTNVTGTSATVSWTTDDATAISVVNYGTTTAYGSQSATMPAGTTQSVTLTGLTAGTTYNFAVTATSGAGATASSGNFTFGTTASFTISAPASVSLGQGQSTNVPILVADTGGYTGSVTLSVAGLPTGATGTFQATAGGASLALSIPSTVLAATYPLTVTGTAGGTSVSAPVSLTISGASQSQTITFNAIPSQYVGATVNAVATASSGLSVTFSVVQNGNCSVSGSTVTFLKIGNCGIIASQAGNGVYQPVSVGQVVVVASALPPQTITFNTIADQTVGSTLSLSASASSGLPVSFTSSPTNICNVSGSTASFVGSGTCTIVASQGGNSSFAAAPTVSHSFNVAGQAQTITFAGIATQTAGTTLTLSASSTSGLTVSFTSSAPSVCSVSGTTLTLNSAGQCTIIASQAGNTAYAAASTVQQTFTVNAALQAQTITFGTIAAQNVGTPLTLTASASSGLAVSYASTTTTVCTVSNSTVTFLTTGKCTITASQAGDNTYSAATPVSQNIQVNAALKPQTITFGAIAAQYVGTPLTLTGTASSDSGLTVSFSTNTPSFCTVSGTTTVSAQFIAAGTCTIVASQAGNGAYAAATPVAQNIMVNPTAYTQTITFNQIASQRVGTSLTLTATASSQLAVSYSATPSSVCTVSGSVVSLVGAGQCNITASQAGNNGFQPAPSVTQSFTVSPGAQTITFGAIAAQTVGTPLTLSATSTSGLTVSFASTTSSVCTVSGTTATFITAGQCTITASQGGNANYAAATPVSQNITVNPALQSQTITFGTIAAQTVGTPLTLSATASSGLTVSYASSTTGVCTASGSTVTFAAAGECSITASQAGNSTYSAAAPVTQSFTVNAAPKAQTITFGSISAQQVGTPLTLSASASSRLTVAFASNSTSVCTVSGTTATFVATGTCSITASQAGSSAYTAAAPVTQSFTVNGQGQIITFTSVPAQQVGATVTLTAKSSSGLAVGFAASPSSVCSLSGTTASFVAAGTCILTASQAGNSTYAPASVSQSVTVQPPPSVITSTTAVNFGSSANIYGMFNDGSIVTNNGLDTSSYAYSATLLGTSLTFQGVPYSFGTAGTANGVSSVTLSLPAGNYTALNFLGTGAFGNQPSQTFTVTYTDGTTSTFTQSLSDWGAPQSNSGETTAFTMSYRLNPSGGQQAGPWYLYSYSFALNSSKTVKSLTLPNARSVIVLAVTLSVSKTVQTITFGSIPTQTAGTTLALQATASSGLAVTYAASPSSVCSVSGTTASFAAAGTCTITASQAGNSSYAAATAVSQSVTVQAAPAGVTTTTVSLGSAANINGIVNDGSAVANGGLDTSSYAYSANLLGTSLTLQGIPYSFGTPGTANAASSTTIALPSGSYTALNFLGTAIYGNQPSKTFTVNYSDGTSSTFTQSMSDWGTPQSYSGESTASKMAYRLGYDGSQQAGAWYLYAYSLPLNSAKTVTSFTLPNIRNVVVVAVTLSGTGSQQAAQTITFGSIAAQTVGTPLTLNATASSGLAVTYASSTTSVCTVSGSTATFVAAGTCTITASQAGNSSYAVATPVSQGFTVNAALTSQTITFGSIAAQTVGTPLALNATASSGLAVTYASSTTSVCTVSGSTATFVAAGTCTITASQAGNSSYAAATSISQSFTVNAALKSQTITFGSIAAQVVGTPLTLNATASSGLTVSYASSTTGVCTVSGSTATFVATGTCSITASQAGNSTYAAATPVSQSFTVAAAIATNTTTTTVSLGSAANVYGIFKNGSSITNGGFDTASYAYSGNLLGTSLTFQGIPYSFGTAGSANAISATTLTLPAGSYSGLNFVGAGVFGNQPSQTFTVTYTDGTTSTFTQNISDWGTPQTYAGESAASTMAYRLTSTGAQQTGSWYLYSYSFALNNAKTVKSLTLPGTRNVVVLAVTLSSTQTAQTITFGTIPTQTVGTTLALGATASSGLAVSYSASPSSVCSVSGTTASFAAAGNCTIVASQAGNSNYAAATAVSQSFSVISTGQRYVPVTAFRAVDTRNSTILASGTSRSFTISGTGGVPASALAYALNVTVVPSGTLQSLTVYPTGGTQPSFPLMSSDGRVKSQTAIIQAGTGGAITIAASNATQVIVDVSGYFVPASNSSGLTFYPITPTRLFDTRSGTALAAGQTTNFAIQSTAGIPTNAQAYSLNITAIPSSTLGNITVWPTGQTQPSISTLNAGTNITANAAIVGAGTNGSISVATVGATNLLIDINGYWAPAGSGGLSLYPVTPVRTYTSGTSTISGTVAIAAPAASTGIPSTANALLMNATVTPPNGFGYLTLWAAGAAFPNVSNLNALDAAVTSNLAFVGTTNGSVSVYASNPTLLTLDVYGYFAP